MTLIRSPAMPMAINMSHVVQLVLPLTQFVATLSRPLSCSDIVNLLPLKRMGKHERQPGQEARMRPHPVRPAQPRKGGAAANAQRRHHCGRVLDRTANQSRAGAKAACGFARVGGEVGEAVGGVGGIE